MRAMPRTSGRPRIPVTGAPAGPEARHPPDPAGNRGIARMARSYGKSRDLRLGGPGHSRPRRPSLLRYVASMSPSARISRRARLSGLPSGG